MPRHPRTLRHTNSPTNIIHHVLEIADPRIIVILAGEERLAEIGRVRVGERMCVCVPAAEADVETADAGAVVVYDYDLGRGRGEGALVGQKERWCMQRRGEEREDVPSRGETRTRRRLWFMNELYINIHQDLSARLLKIRTHPSTRYDPGGAYTQSQGAKPPARPSYGASSCSSFA